MKKACLYSVMVLCIFLLFGANCHAADTIRKIAPTQTISPFQQQQPAPGGIKSDVAVVPGDPSISYINPMAVMQGQTYTLDMRFSNYRPGMIINLGDGIQVLGQPVMMDTMKLNIKVAPDAPVGVHLITIIENGRPYQARPYITVIAAPPKAASPTNIISVNPGSVKRGQSYLLELTANNFRPGMQLDFGQGITVTGQPMIADKVRVNVQVAPDAPLGPHAVNYNYDGVPHNTSASLMVEDASSGMNIISLSPPVWESGKTYSVIAVGQGLSDGMEVRFGDNIAVKDLEVVSQNMAKFKAEVASAAEAGLRHAELRPDVAKTWNTTTATVSVTKAAAVSKAALPNVVKLPDITKAKFEKSVIYLDTPEWGNFSGVEIPDDYGIPGLNDKTVFKWSEQNPGTAEWFELRLMKPDGNVVMKKQVGDLTYFRPDPAFLSDLLDVLVGEVSGNAVSVASGANKTAQVNKGAIKNMSNASNESGASASKVVSSAEKAVPPTPEEKYIAAHKGDISLYWEVAGYRTYYKSVSQTPGGDSVNDPNSSKPKSEKVDYEVEVSERWPLGMGKKKPTGMACSSGLGNILPEKIGGNPSDLAYHIGDTIRFSGNMSFKDCPWNIAVQVTPKYNPGQQLNLDVDSYSFNNAYIDWGDGCVENLKAFPTAPASIGVKFQNASQLKIDRQHKYWWNGDFTVRIYVLPEDDTSMLGDIADANATKGNSPYSMLLSLIGSMQSGTGRDPSKPLLASLDTLDSGTSDAPPAVLMAAAGSGAQKAGVSGTGMGKAGVPIITAAMSAADRAFMAYCHTLNVAPVTDTDAIGPLNLDSIAISDFSGQGGGLNKNIKASVSAITKKAPSGIGGSKTAAKVGKSLAISEAAKSAAGAQGAGKTFSASDAAKKTNVSSQAVISGMQIQADATVTTCEPGLIATATVKYFGEGWARITWKVRGMAVSSETIPLGPSTPRTNLPEDKSKWGPPLLSEFNINSPLLGVKDAGLYDVTVDAMVVPDPTFSKLSGVNFNKYVPLGNAGADTGGGKGKQSPSEAANIAQYQVAKEMKGAAKFGFLAPSQKAGSGMAPVALANLASSGQSLAGAAAGLLLQKPNYVVSDKKTYLVVQPDPDFPCVFHFPVTGGGYFTVGGLKDKISITNGKWSGSGTLFYYLPYGPDSVKPYYTDIPIKDWDVPGGTDVSAGSISATPSAVSIDTLPGIKAVPLKFAGNAGGSLMASFKMTIADPTLMLTNTQKPQEWPSLSAPLSPEGDWYITGQKLPVTLIGGSLFKISSDDVTIDLSQKEGDGIGTAGKKWVGVSLGKSAHLEPYVMELANITVDVPDWYIGQGGLTGSTSTGTFDHVFGEGSIHFDTINVSAANHALTALYKGLSVHVPWPDVVISGGDAKLVYGVNPGQGVDLNFNFQPVTTKKLDYGPVNMVAQVNSFMHGTKGWGIMTDTTFGFKEGLDDFWSVPVSGVFYNMNGFAYFDGDKTSKTVAASGKSKLGGSPLSINSIGITTLDNPNPDSPRISFIYYADLSISKSLSSSAVEIMYGIKRAYGSYVATGPVHEPFTLNVSFPEGSPVNKSAIAPQLVSSGATAQYGRSAMYASLGPVIGTATDAPQYGPIMVASAGGAATDTFVGEVSSKMFGMSLPVEAGFRLGHIGDDDYWMTFCRVYPKIPIYTDVILYKIGGGLGYNFNKNAFVVNSIGDATPEVTNSMIYSAEIGISSADQFAFQVSGILTIIPGQGLVRIDFAHTKIVGLEDIIQGYLEYTPGVFKGEVWGGMSYLDGMVSLQIPQGSSGLYFSSDRWEIYAGTKDKLRINGHIIFADCSSYFQIGNQVGLLIGGETGVNGKICLGFASVKYWANLNVAVAISPGPVFSGDFGGDAGVKACAICKKPCASASAGVTVHAQVPPFSASACFHAGMPCCVPDINECINL